MSYAQREAMYPRSHRPERRGGAGRKILAVVVILLLVLVGFLVYVDFSLKREAAIPTDGQRPADGPGTNWLLVGSDSREGLDAEQEAELGTGDAAGRRTDTMMLVHIPAGGGKPTMVSMPRDSYVKIPGHGKDKLNAAFAFGGPKLLVQTVEASTGVRVDHYAEIGLGGFADMTDAIGGVDMCVKERMVDPKANLDLQPGCQTLNGPQALGYVRTRASAMGDLDRVQHQREFLAALTKQATSPAVFLNPLRVFPLILDVSSAFLVDSNDHIWHLAGLGWAMNGISSGDGVTTTVPMSGFGESGSGGSVIKWDESKSDALFKALQNDTEVPQSAIVNPAGG